MSAAINGATHNGSLRAMEGLCPDASYRQCGKVVAGIGSKGLVGMTTICVLEIGLSRFMPELI
jgi:hypothetical protein